MLKLISIVLSFSLIFSSIAPSYAAGVSAQRQTQNLQASIEEAVAAATSGQSDVEMQIQMIFDQLDRIVNPANAYDPNARGAQLYAAPLQSAGQVLVACDAQLKKVYDEFHAQGQADKYLEKGFVCTEQTLNGEKIQTCSNALAFAQVCSSVALDKRWDGTGALKALTYNPATWNVSNGRTSSQQIVGFAYKHLEKIIDVQIEGDDIALVNWLGKYGIINNYDKTMKYLSQLLKIPAVCTKTDKRDDLFQQKSSECELSLKAMELMANFAQVLPNYKNKVADEIFAFMKNKNREDMAAGPILQGTIALMGLDTDYATDYLIKFMKEETRPTKWRTGLDALGSFSVEGVVEAAAGIGEKQDYYYNSYTERFNYLDPTLTELWYVYTHTPATTGQTQIISGLDRVNMIHEGKPFNDDSGVYQFPNGNLYEDIGALIARDSVVNHNARSTKLAKSIWSDAKDVHYLGRYPRPLFVGLLLGGYGEQAGREELSRLANTNFVDMNEGTQRRFRMNIDKALKTPAEMQKIDNSEREYQKFIALPKYAKRDDGKYNSYTRYIVAHKAGMVVDFMLIAYFATRIVVGIAKWVGSLPTLFTKSIKNIRTFGTKVGKHFNAVRTGSKQLVFRGKDAARTAKASRAAGTTAGATARSVGATTRTATAGSTATGTATGTASVTTGTTATAGTTATTGTDAAAATRSAGRTGQLVIDPDGIPQIKPIVVQPAETIKPALKSVRAYTASVGEGSTGASASTGLTYRQASQRLKTIKKEVETFKGTSLEGKFNTTLNKYLSEARAAKRAAGGSSHLGLMDRLSAYEKALAETTKDIEFIETAAEGVTKVSPEIAATAYTLNNEIDVMNAATKAAGRTAGRIYTDADIPWTLRARIAAETFLNELGMAGQGVARAAVNPQGRGALVALAGMINPAVTGDAIKAAQIFAETSRPAIVMVADTEHAGTLSVRMLTAAGLEMPTKPITIAASKLPASLMSFEEAYKILTPVFLNMGLKTYDEVFSEAAIAKAFEANPDAAIAYYTFDKVAEREIFNAYSSGKQVAFTAEPKATTEIVAQAPTTATTTALTEVEGQAVRAVVPPPVPVALSAQGKQAIHAALRINVANKAQVAGFTARVLAGNVPTRIAATDLTGGLVSSLMNVSNRAQYQKYQTTIGNYLSQVLEEAEKAKALDSSLSEQSAILAGVGKVLSKDTVLPDDIKASFVDEVSAILLGTSPFVTAEINALPEAFETADFNGLLPSEQVLDEAFKFIPLQGKDGVLYRGMALSANGTSLNKILEKGLLLEDVSPLASTLLTSMGGAIGYGGVRAARHTARNINLTNSPQKAAQWGATRISDPSKQIVVVTEVSGLNAADTDIVNYTADIAPEKISAVYALLNVDGKPTWCLVEAGENGKFKLTPMSVVEGKNTATSSPQTAQAENVVSLPENANYAMSAAEGTTRGEAWEDAVDDAVSAETKYSGIELVIQEAIGIAKEQYHALGVQNVSTYVSLLVPTIKEALTKANVELNTPETIEAVNKSLLLELGENHLLRQQAVDAITGRELTGLKKFWRWVATQATGKMVNLDESDLLDLSNHVLKALVQDNVTINYDALREAIQAGTTLVKKEQGSYQETDANGQVSNRSYDKETHDFSRILAQFTPAALQFTQHSNRFGFRPRLINTDVKGFPYLYTSIKLKLVNKDKEGHTLLRQNVYTVVLSDDDKLFKTLKENEILVVDTYGNLYKSTQLKDGKEKRTPIFDRKISVVKLADLNDMPVVVIQKTQNRMSALNSIYQAMGLSSTGRFLNSFLSDQYGVEGGALAGGNASGWATSISTGVYFTNIAPLLGLHQAVEKFGGKKVLNFFLSLSVLCSLGVAGINLFGGNPHGWITLLPVIMAIGSSGLASAAIQQISNPTAQRMLNGKEAGDIVAGGQLQKTIGSLMTYGFASLAIILTGNWEFMYGLIAIPTLRALWAINVADLPLAIKKKEAPKAEVAADANSVEARNEEGKLSSSKFFLDPKILALFSGLMLFCGSETQASTATKSIITGLIKGTEWIQSFVNWLADALAFMPWVSAEGMDAVTATGLVNDSIGTLISGLATMLPVLIGRNIAKSLMSKYKGVAKYNEKMWLISGLGIAAALMSLYFIGPSAGLWLLPSVVLANGLLGNMFTFTFNMMKNHDKEKYNNAFSNLAGSLSTIAVVGCFLIPTLTNFIIPGKGLEIAFQQLIVPILGVAVALGINFKNFANPFDWKKPMNKAQLEQLQTSVISQMALFAPDADLSELEAAAAQANPDLTQEEVHALVEKNVSRLKTELASAMGLSSEELVGLINGTLSKEIKESAFVKLAEQLNVKFKSLTKEDALLENRIVNQLMLQVNAGASRLAEEHHSDELEGLNEDEVNP